MPILPKEDNLYPPDVLSPDFCQSEASRWLVVHTKPRQEKSLARAAVAGEIPVYLPIVQRRNQVRGKILDSYVPLFPGYVFALVDEAQRVALLKTNAVAQCLQVDDEEKLVRELRNLELLISSDAPVTIEQKLEPGRLVRVKSGPMANTEGVVVTRRGKSRLVVAVTLLQQGVSVEIEDFQVEPVY